MNDTKELANLNPYYHSLHEFGDSKISGRRVNRVKET